jgi:signal transduction histidine kinase
MLFRTKLFLSFIALGAVSIGAAFLLIISSQRNEENQLRTNLAHESLSGYFQLSGDVFRTFKQTRRDLISGPGTFAFDFEQATQDIHVTLDRIEEALVAEASLMSGLQSDNAMQNLNALRTAVMQALSDIRAASDMIVAGQMDAGRKMAIEVLQGQVDVEIATLIQDATSVQRAELAAAQREIRAFQETAEITAWMTVGLAVLLSTAIFLTLLRRFQTGLRELDAGAKAYAANDLDYVIDLAGRDELSAVARSFTDMAQQIRSKQTALEAARDELEQRVADRTSALSAANAELRTNDAMRRQFFADIGHELRTPVSAIRGEAEVALRARTGREKAQESALKTIVSIADELTAGVDDLFLIAREMAGVLDFRTAPVDLKHAVSLGIEQLQSLSGQKDAVITQHLAPEQIVILGERPRIAQLVRILISNALEHAKHAVNIHVSVVIEDSNAVLSIADDGPGIPEKDWPRIFDRFVKGTDRPAGTGLGLAIAKSIALAHGGTIRVQHSASGGADLQVRFPLLQGPATR